MLRQLTLLLAVALLAGCAPGSNDELRGLVDDVAPAERQMIECNWGTSWGDDSGSYYDCFYLVPGKLNGVGRAVLKGLAQHGFTVTCRMDAHTIELIGAREGTMFYADILSRGFVHGRNVDESDVDVPQGHVLIEVAAIEGDAGVQPGRLCAS